MRHVVLALLALALIGPLIAEEPPLPPGLAPPAAPSPPSEPPLPPGLGTPAEPALPPGLGAPAEPALPPGLDGPAGSPETPQARERRFPLEIHGFWDLRGGVRLRHDPTRSRDATLGETRLQLKTRHDWTRVSVDFTGDFYLDAVSEQAEVDLRQLRLTWTPTETLDLRIGRQVLTWGTGDLLFINDLFPKDWVSFLIGRDVEYLKAPSNSLRVGWYPGPVNVELVYTPQFAADRFITGERLTYFSPLAFGAAGDDDIVQFRQPDAWFRHHEIAARVYRTVGKWELAAYGYHGYWKSPGGQTLLPPRATFPDLGVYGASARGPLGPGIFHAEFGYYDSRDDRAGRNPFVNNSELRLLLGYEFEAAKEFTVGVQYYVEHMLRHGRYEDTLPFFVPARDRERHVVTLRLTKLLMNQDLNLSLFTFYSPSDTDAYFRPQASYKFNDAWSGDLGANLFVGRHEHSFFGQFQKNSNLYAAIRFSF